MDAVDEVSVADAAGELGLSVRAVQKRLATGLLRGRNVGGRIWVVPREEVERAKQEGRLKPGPKPKER